MTVYRYVLILICLGSLVAEGKEQLIASGHSEYPPFAWRQGDNIIGVGPEITTMIFTELGYQVAVDYVGPWARVLQQAKMGEIDVIVGIYQTTERKSFLAYPEEFYIRDPVVIFYNKDNPVSFNDWSELIGKQGGSVTKESFGEKFDHYAKKHLTIHRTTEISQSFRMLAKGRLDYVVYGLYPGLIRVMDIGLSDKLGYVNNSVHSPLSYQAISINSEVVKDLPYLSKRLKELRADGTMDKLIAKYMAYWQEQHKLPKVDLTH